MNPTPYKNIFRLLLLIALLALPARTFAQAATTRAAPADFLAPFIDSQTIAVAHLDATKIDTAALQKYITELMDAAKVPADDDLRKNMTLAKGVADVFLTRFQQLGGRHVYALLSHPDIWPHQQPVALLIKIEPGGDAKALRELLTSTFGIDPPQTEPATLAPVMLDDALRAVMLRDDVLFIGQTFPLKRLQTLKPEARWELALTTPDAPFEAVAAFTADQRRVLVELLPAFPQEIGGGSTAFLSQEGLVARFTLTLPPKPSLSLAFESPALKLRVGNLNDLKVWNSSSGLPPSSVLNYTPELDALILKLRDLLLASPQFAAALKDPDFPFQAHVAEFTAALKEILTPVNGTLTLQDKHIRQLVPFLLEEQLNIARIMFGRTQSAKNIRAIVMAVVMYSQNHDDKFPESLAVLVQAKTLTPDQLLNPADPKHRPYVYRPIIPYNTVDASVPLVWEQVDDEKSGLNVGYADAHVEWLRTGAELKADIKRAEELKAQMDAKKARLDTQPKQP